MAGFQRSLERLVVEAKVSGRKDVMVWADGRADQFARQVIDAMPDGILTEEPLERQLAVLAKANK